MQLIRRVLITVLLIFISMNSQAEEVWVDVRSALEHTIDNIEGDIRISHSEIVQELSKLHSDKKTVIKLYCRSGNRAGKAMIKLQQAGYINVSNAGGIDDARTIRGLNQ